ncbi:hypothetical protein DEO23_13980 [Brachybacterium endophyticum]|uniref:Uncharacterized protein n=2 Tax=Brachybacterium endophyticum TaxID=2182385 RepID=A0A2U2RHD5_9MICO|nr:hypothetical protein DEO23_13980 [Brachybacterium endophyticum]
MPASWSNKKKVERLRKDAFDSLTRMLPRAVAETGANFSIWSALRTHADQVALFTANYTPAGRGRTLSTDRSYQGRIWKRKAGGVSVASPDLGSNHEDGLAVDIHPAAIQAWIKTNGLRFGWSWDEGRRVGENWHFRYIASKDQYTSEGRLNHYDVQKALGVTADGKIGTGTVAKIKAFQKAHGLTVDGKIGPATKKKLLAGKGDAPAVTTAGATTTAKPATVVASATPGWMPGADRSQTWTGNSHKAPVTKIVLHTTEGGSWPTYGGGGSAPHFTVHRDGTVRQHIETTKSAKALEHPAGTPETNNGGCIQIEFIGSCDRAYAVKNGLFFTEDAQDQDLAGLASVLAWISAAHGIPLTADGLSWPTTNAAYTTAPQRMSASQWAAYTGVCGHTHVVANSHWDPGAFPVARLLDLAGGAPAAVTGKPVTTPTSSVTLPEGKALLMKLKDLPDFPLLRTSEHKCYYGDESKLEAVSGKSANSLVPGEIFGSGKSSGAHGLKAWQKKVGITADGRFGPGTDKAARTLQAKAGLTVDGKIGPTTFFAAWLA